MARTKGTKNRNSGKEMTAKKEETRRREIAEKWPQIVSEAAKLTTAGYGYIAFKKDEE